MEFFGYLARKDHGVLWLTNSPDWTLEKMQKLLDSIHRKFHFATQVLTISEANRLKQNPRARSLD
jgi:hypothetical protein